MTTPGSAPLPGAPPPIDLMGIARQLLSIVVDGFALREVTLPVTRYISPGASAAYDTDQVTVNIGNITPGRPGGPMPVQDPGATSQYATFTVSVVRPVAIGDDGSPPSTRESEESAEAVAVDVATLYDVLTGARWRSAFGENIPVGIIDVHTEGPQGAVASSVAVVQVQVT